MVKIPAQHAHYVFAVVMSMVMAFVVSSFVTYINTGMSAGFVVRWIHAFMLAWPVACISILLFVGRVRRLVAWLTAT